MLSGLILLRMTTGGMDMAYRGYLLKAGFDGMIYVSKDGTHIASYHSVEAAKLDIDKLLD